MADAVGHFHQEGKPGGTVSRIGGARACVAFYEIECIRGGWSVRELRRQIGSLYFERSGLSTDKEKLAEIVRNRAEQATERLPIKDPYVFEFLGLNAAEVMEEEDLEAAILRNLQRFLQEMGMAFVSRLARS